MKTFVSGSDGFIGSHLVKELKRRGHDVIESDINKNDIRTINEKDLDGVDWIFHMGAASGSLWFDPPKNGIDINCVGTINLLEMAKKAKVKKFVFSSTGSSYAWTPLPHTENCVLNVPNFYAATKIFNEMECKLYKELYGLETVILRYASVYGDNEDKKGNLANVVSQFIWKMMKNEPAELWGKGDQTRDFIFVDDIVSANIFAAESLPHGIYNAGTGVETKFIDVVNKINENLGTNIQPIYMPIGNSGVQLKYVDRQQFDISKLAKKGWRSMISVDEGIRRIIADIKSRGAIFDAKKI